MTEKQKKFCNEYIITLNATQSAISVGYSKKTAYSIGQRLLKNVEIKNYIDERLKQMEDERTATGKEVIEYLTSVMRGEHESEIIINIGGETRVIKRKPDEKEMLKASELLGKRYGLFSEKVQVDGNVPVVIVDDLEDDDD